MCQTMFMSRALIFKFEFRNKGKRKMSENYSKSEMFFFILFYPKISAYTYTKGLLSQLYKLILIASERLVNYKFPTRASKSIVDFY